MSEKEIHFFVDIWQPGSIPEDACCVLTYQATRRAIQQRYDKIWTTQMCFVSTRLLECGYRIFIHEQDGDVYEVKLGKNNCTNREIRPGHDLFKLWQAGEFSINKS